MSKLKFNGSTHFIELVSSTGKRIDVWMAYNNIDSGFAAKHYDGQTHLANGTYSIIDTKQPHVHPGDTTDGSFGRYGIVRFTYPKHPGVGVHSGRAHAKNKPGPQHATHGCIRTTDAAMLAIQNHIAKDPLTTIEIAENDKVKAATGKPKLHHVVHPGETMVLGSHAQSG